MTNISSKFRLLIIDNYDSFVYNLYQELGKILLASSFSASEILDSIDVVRNDELSNEEIVNISENYTHLLLSPGPSRPENAGSLIKIIKSNFGKIPMLGVCLGHQGICQALGAEISYAKNIMHGKRSKMVFEPEGIVDSQSPYGILNNVKNNLLVARYHSLVVKKSNLPESIKVLAFSDDGEIMVVKCTSDSKSKDTRNYCAYGLQFHPESILTDSGAQILKNWLNSI